MPGTIELKQRNKKNKKHNRLKKFAFFPKKKNIRWEIQNKLFLSPKKLFQKWGGFHSQSFTTKLRMSQAGEAVAFL